MNIRPQTLRAAIRGVTLATISASIWLAWAIGYLQGATPNPVELTPTYGMSAPSQPGRHPMGYAAPNDADQHAHCDTAKHGAKIEAPRRSSSKHVSKPT